MAVEHFLERGFRHFAFCGTPYGQHVYQDERSDRFRAELQSRGFEYAAYRRFRQQLGRSPKQEQTRLRITRARERLEDTDLSIAEIARRIGYAEEKYFVHVFKQQTSTTPLKYRKGKLGK